METTIRKLEDFLTLYQSKWISSLSKPAQSVINETRFNKPSGIPNESDVFELNKNILYIFKKQLYKKKS